ELLQISSMVDFLATRPGVDAGQIAIVGDGQGGMTALYAGALDTRIKAAVSSGYLNDPQPEWEQPEDRMIWKLRADLSNDQIARLVAPRKLLVSSEIGPAELDWLAQELKPAPLSPATGSAVVPSMDLEKVSEIANAQFSQWQAFFRNKALEAADSIET